MKEKGKLIPDAERDRRIEKVLLRKKKTVVVAIGDLLKRKRNTSGRRLSV